MREPGAAGSCGSSYRALGGCSGRDEALGAGVWALGRAAAARDGGTNVLIRPMTALSLLGWGWQGAVPNRGLPGVGVLAWDRDIPVPLRLGTGQCPAGC